jgi:hypothetical protein
MTDPNNNDDDAMDEREVNNENGGKKMLSNIHDKAQKNSESHKKLP